jgi:hypothetical protein
MAWFDPPLYKPGNHKCRKCGQSQGRMLSIFMVGRTKWRCPQCQSQLELDVGRALLAWPALAIPIMAIGLVLGFTGHILPGWLVYPASLVMAVVDLWWFFSVKLKEAPGQPQSSQADKPPEQSSDSTALF